MPLRKGWFLSTPVSRIAIVCPAPENPLAAAAVLSLVSIGSIPAEANGGAATRRFRGTGEGVVTQYVTDVNWIIEYTGHSTLLGPYTRTEDVTFTGPGVFEGTITFVSQFGEEIWVDFEGHFIGEHDAVADYTITGGTGRFAGATGTATVEAHTEDFDHVSIRFDGWITY